MGIGIGKQRGDASFGFVVAMLLCLVGLIVYSVYKDSTTPSYTKSITQNYEMDKDLKGCTVHYLRSSKTKNLYVVRCPSTTTTQWEDQEGKYSADFSATTDNY